MTEGVQTGGGAMQGQNPDKRDQSDPFEASRQGTTTDLESIGKAINSAAEKLRKGEPTDPELLKQLNMSAEEFSSFVKKYEKRLNRSAGSTNGPIGPDPQQGDASQRPGSEARQGGRGVGEGIGGVTRQADVKSDEQRKLRESHRTNLSDEMKQVVNDFYKVVGGGNSE